jgi:hypothetical protein
MFKLKSNYSDLSGCLLIVLCVLFSCRQSSKIEKALITTEKDSIWLLKSTGKDTSIHFGHLRLENGGRARFFMSTVDNEPSAEITGMEGEIKYTWFFDKNDSTLSLGGENPFKINKLNKDTIFMTLNDQKKFLLIRQYYKPTL